MQRSIWFLKGKEKKFASCKIVGNSVLVGLEHVTLSVWSVGLSSSLNHSERLERHSAGSGGTTDVQAGAS